MLALFILAILARITGAFKPEGDAKALLAYGSWLECLNAPSSDSGGYRQLIESFPPIERACLESSLSSGGPSVPTMRGRPTRDR
jgi:hypothetical protein